MELRRRRLIHQSSNDVIIDLGLNKQVFCKKLTQKHSEHSDTLRKVVVHTSDGVFHHLLALPSAEKNANRRIVALMHLVLLKRQPFLFARFGLASYDYISSIERP